MGRDRYRYPITSHMIKQGLHDAIVRAAENKSESGGTNPRIKRSIVIESMSVVEMIMKDAIEEYRRRRGGDKPVDVFVEDVGAEASVPQARIDAAMQVRMTLAAFRDAAVQCRMRPMVELLDSKDGSQGVKSMADQRHGYIHSFSRDPADDGAACRTVDAMLVAAFDGRPAEMAATRLIEGIHMEAAGRIDEAMAAHRAALEVCRDYLAGGGREAWAHLCAGHALSHLGRDDESEAAFHRAVRADPSSPGAHLQLGHLALLGGRYHDADRMYSRAIELDPSYSPARVFRGHARLMVKGSDGRLALLEYDLGLALDPHDISGHVGRGLSLARRGLHGEAAAHFERAIGIDPDDAASYVALGHARAAEGRDAEAGDGYGKAIEVGSGTAAWFALSSVRIDRAARMRHRLGGVSAHLGMAGVLFRAGRHEEALKHYREATALDGGSAGAHAGAGRMLSILGQWEEAVPAYREAIGIDPRSAEARRGLADSLSKSGRFEEAVPAYREAIGIDPRSAEARRGLADSLSKSGRFEEAVPAYREAIGIDPRSAEARRGLAHALSMTGRSAEARREYERAAALDPAERDRGREPGGWGE